MVPDCAGMQGNHYPYLAWYQIVEVETLQLAKNNSFGRSHRGISFKPSTFLCRLENDISIEATFFIFDSDAKLQYINYQARWCR